MIELSRIDPAFAEHYIDFGAGGISRAVAAAQLDGAVAIHNILAQHGVAYLADEVGMGKTYVALGVVALIRALHPGLRVLYIAPRANIQRKWCERELQNFVAHAWQRPDQRVRTLDGQPAAPFVTCERLIDWAQTATRNPDRDVFLRMTSFSIGLPDAEHGKAQWHNLRQQLRDVAPFLATSDLDARTNDKEAFKEAYGRVLNRLVPKYDLVVVDEAHNLKHGPESSSTRNRMLATVLGGRLSAPRLDGAPPKRRFDRVLFLSATPLETDFKELGNQLRLFGFDALAKPLCDEHPDGDDAKREHARTFVVRRLATIRAGERLLSKTEYRREWLAGGVDTHDAPLAIPDLRQKLVVALMQKKVTELVKKKFNAQFQIGMLASFESFAGTVSTFDDPDQTDDEGERKGIDADIVTSITRSYRSTFGEPLPHPKMKSVVQDLATAMRSGEKSLVFVRRVRSVDELSELLCRAYDSWLCAANEGERPLLPEHLHGEWNALWKQYAEERERYFKRRRLFDAPPAIDAGDDGEEEPPDMASIDADPQLRQRRGADTGGYDTFFAWFFRGEPRPDDPRRNLVSGASFRRNRLDSEGAALHLLFEENHVAALLGDPGDVLAALAKAISKPIDETDAQLRALAQAALARGRGKPQRSHVFRAFQEAGLWLLKESSQYSEQASVVLEEWYPLATGLRGDAVNRHSTAEQLSTRTFFMLLRQRPVLRARLWPDDAQAGEPFRERFRRRELRRLLMSSVMRLGHPMIDLWALGVRGMRSLRGSGRGTADSLDRFATEFLDLLERQLSEPGHTSARELALLADNFSLVLQTNFPTLTHAKLPEVTTRVARVLGRQSPVAGMSGSHRSDTAIQQFRMPGYPFVMVATDILQEGEDLHTFCARVIHYGLAWTPSSIEQRTGRVDRIGSLVHRRIEARDRLPTPEERLQIYYPYLADTVERLQAARVFDRLKRFIRLMHRGYGDERAQPTIDTDDAFVRSLGVEVPAVASAESSFPLRSEDLVGATRVDTTQEELAARTLALFDEHLEQVARQIRIEWVAAGHDARRFGTVRMYRGQVVEAGGAQTDRVQPVALYLRADGRGQGTMLHVVSPIAKASADCRADVAAYQSECTDAKLTETDQDDETTVLYSAEVHVRFHPDEVDLEETLDAIRRAAGVADQVEQRFFAPEDRQLDTFRPRLERDARR